jgi:large subunit ribosomal protein L30
MSDKMITVTQVKSGAHAKPKTRGTLRALGLGRIGKANTLPDRPEIRGMIRRVPHLITVSAEDTANTVSAEDTANTVSAGDTANTVSAEDTKPNVTEATE